MRYYKVMTTSFYLTALALLALGLIMIFTRHDDLFAAAFVLGLLATWRGLTFHNKLESLERERRVNRAKTGWKTS